MRKFTVCLLLCSMLFLPGCSLSASKTADDLKNMLTASETRDNSEDESAVKEEVANGDVKKPEIKRTLDITLYYQDKDGYIIPVTRKVVMQEGIAKAAINGIIDNASSREQLEYYGIYPVLPLGTGILGINIKEGIATIDFNKGLLGYNDEKSEKNIIASVVYTLTEFKTVNGVKILINGHPEGKLKYGTDISGTLTRENALVNSKKLNLGDGLSKVDVYLFKHINESYTYILPVSVEYKSTDKGAPARIIELLSKDYGDGKLYSELPVGTRLLGSELKDKVLKLDFNEKFTNYGGTAREDGILRQILYSMKQLKDVDKVKILIGGKTGDLPEGTDLSKDIAFPVIINSFIDQY